MPAHGEILPTGRCQELLFDPTWSPLNGINKAFLRQGRVALRCAFRHLFSLNAGSLQKGDKKATKFNEERKASSFHAIDFYSLFTCLLRVVSFTCDSLFRCSALLPSTAKLLTECDTCCASSAIGRDGCRLEDSSSV